MSQPLTLQEMLIRLQGFWAGQGCVIWQPYNIQVGAGTMNPATFLRVLGPEPWNVAYVEPSVRPDDGRYGDNPNRMQYYYQYQVILKPDPGNPQEIYLQSLEALGIDRKKHDIRFVEDNWKQPALGAWGLGWEVWLDGLEITQFTYFQQAGGQNLDPVSVEITYGVERILVALQGVSAAWDIAWNENLKYKDVLLQSEIEHCTYYFELADVERLRETYATYESEADRCLRHDPPLVIPAHDYVLKMSHLFNVLDTRGAVGVIERAEFFKRMQILAARVSKAYIAQRAALNYPTLPADWHIEAESGTLRLPAPPSPMRDEEDWPEKPALFVLEIGCEELPAADLDSALEQLAQAAPDMLDKARLAYTSLEVAGTPRRLVLMVEGLQVNQKAEERIERGPPVKAAFDSEGRPTPAAEGFARGKGVPVEALLRVTEGGGEYVAARIDDRGRPAVEVLGELLPELIAGLRFEEVMRWNGSGVAFPRPLRWYVALLGSAVVPFRYAWVDAGRHTRGTRAGGSPEIKLKSAKDYLKTMEKEGVILGQAERRQTIEAQINLLTEPLQGQVQADAALLDEVVNLVEEPTALLGRFDEDFLELPEEVLITVMRKHQRYFALRGAQGKLLPAFITVRNGGAKHLESVRAGNEQVLRARYADARFFYNADLTKPLPEYVEGLKTLAFQESLGSYFEKTQRIVNLVGHFADDLGLSEAEKLTAQRAASLAKADLATQMVVEMTSLQGVMGRVYALKAGEREDVARAIEEHYQPRAAGDSVPQSGPGMAVAVADRLDSLVGLFAAGLEPTGGADPYALRRAALGVLQILLEHHISADLRTLIDTAAAEQPIEVTEEVQARLLQFLKGRLQVLLRDDFPHDVVEAVLGAVAHDPQQAVKHAEQLVVWIARPDWERLLDAYARCARITRSQPQQFELVPEAFTTPAEQELYAAYQQLEAELGQYPDVDRFLAGFTAMVPAVEKFFGPAEAGGVLVMDPEQAVRENRLALLQHIVAAGAQTADFSQLKGF